MQVNEKEFLKTSEDSIKLEALARKNMLMGNLDEANKKNYCDLKMLALTNRLKSGEISEKEFEKVTDILLDFQNGSNLT
jgi:inorganic pyrophosphatase/exopolyphosphatase